MDFTSIPIVATAISLVIAWALFAIMCSLINEAIAQIKAERGRFMRKHLLKQLFDHPNGINWANMLYLHGTIDLLSRSSNKPTSDITPHLFAETIIEVVGNAQVTQMRKQEVLSELNYKSPMLNDFKAATMVLQPSDVMGFLKQAMSVAEICGGGDEAKVYDSLVLQIKSWYEQMTQRMTVWYGKKTRMRLFLLGSVLALVINVDSIQLFSHFNKNGSSRQVMIDYYKSHAGELAEMAQRLDLKTPEKPVAAAEPAEGTAEEPPAPEEDSSKAMAAINELKKYGAEMEQLAKEAELPVGWDHSLLKKGTSESNVLLKILGILLSGGAASFGAPFWFQLLKKVTPVKTQKN